MNRPARVFSEADVLEAEIRRKTDEVERMKLRLASLRGAPPPLRAVEEPVREPVESAAPDEVMPLAEVEKRYILDVLQRFDGNRTHTARALGIGTNTLWRKLKAWGEPPARN